MNDDGFFIEQSICIVGLGLMVGSLALALRGYCNRIIGVDPDFGTLALACEKNVVDFATDHLAEALPQADLVILAAPVRTNLDLLEKIPQPGDSVAFGKMRFTVENARNNRIHTILLSVEPLVNLDQEPNAQ